MFYDVDDAQLKKIEFMIRAWQSVDSLLMKPCNPICPVAKKLQLLKQGEIRTYLSKINIPTCFGLRTAYDSDSIPSAMFDRSVR